MKRTLLFLILLSCSSTNAQQTDQRFKAKATESFLFAKKNKMDTMICILIDMKAPSGKYRLIVYDFQKDSILLEGLCAHGSGTTESVNDMPIFSNAENSHCTSLGKYKIGTRGYSSWGIHINYKLHGLESTNNNAFKRTVVLHSWEGINDTEIYPQRLAQSWGCPTVSNGTMEELDVFLKNRSSVLMWIYF
jgi:hypothetical protein